jgi:tetratricopeptide (TPR) repeat protein
MIFVVMYGYHGLEMAFSLLKVPERERIGILGVLAAILVMTTTWMTIARNRDYRTEETMWRDVTKKQPQNLRAWLGLGTALAEKGQRGEAEACFVRIIEVGGATSNRNMNSVRKTTVCHALSSMGTLREQECRYEEAERYFRQALDLYPLNTQARSNLGIVLSRMGRTAEAEQEWRKVLAQDPGEGKTHYALALALAARKEYASALRHFEAALYSLPNDASVKLALAWFLATCENSSFRDGARAVKLATEANESVGWASVKAMDVLAACLAATGDYTMAVRRATRALELAQRQGRKDSSEIERRLKEYQSRLLH